ncbi:hypothetical protein HOY80DRAFT_160223 [Tuber brumale]|nr:hypothetical protein HOY80DRAFT_160223 [Tuber brumale]
MFQNTVCEILDHVNCIPTASHSSRLFWPPVTTGTECVVDAHGDSIRVKCADMQRDSGFFNGVNGLGVSELIWSSPNEAPENRRSYWWERIEGEGGCWRGGCGYSTVQYLTI